MNASQPAEPVSLQALLDAFDRHRDDPFVGYVDRRAGVVVEVASRSPFGYDVDDRDGTFAAAERAIEAEPERFVQIPVREARREGAVMARWTASLEDEDVRAVLEEALAGGLRRFRGAMHRWPELQALWFAAREAAIAEEARAWCQSIGVAWREDLRAPPPPPPAFPPVPGAPRLGLVDLLLLGAPDGKTELIDGRVRRTMRAASPDAARAIFKNLVRDLCALHGIGWRKRFAQGTTRYEVERFVVEVEGDRVDVTVAVARALWDVFARA